MFTKEVFLILRTVTNYSFAEPVVFFCADMYLYFPKLKFFIHVVVYIYCVLRCYLFWLKNFIFGGGNLLNWWWFIIFGEFLIFLVKKLFFLVEKLLFLVENLLFFGGNIFVFLVKNFVFFWWKIVFFGVQFNIIL